MDQDFADRPNKVPWPPILYLAVVLAVLALEAIRPMGPVAATTLVGLRISGFVIAAAGIGLDLAAMLAMHRARTNILPHRAADRLLTGGVFVISRNPIYLGNTLLLIGVAMALPSLWMAAGALLAAAPTGWRSGAKSGIWPRGLDRPMPITPGGSHAGSACTADPELMHGAGVPRLVSLYISDT